jgi:hypothetical protein
LLMPFELQELNIIINSEQVWIWKEATETCSKTVYWTGPENQ